MTDQSDPRAGIEAAIAALEAQRPVLGDVAVDAALAGLRQKLGELEQAERRPKPAEPRADTAERKFVTVLFADISGFTALSEITDPESVRDIINACFDTFVPIVVRYGGTVDKFIGDEIMALFGAPASHEDDPARALFAALDMMSALKLFNRQRETDLGVHIGINSGLVIAGGLGSKGRQQYSVMGDPVNVAARLETLSDTGQIFVGPDTYQLVEHLFDFEALPPVAIKGKHKLLPIYQLLRPKRESETGRGLSGLRSPLVGRELQMDRLLGLMADLSQGRGRTIAIAGEAGIGKSRLIAELRNESSADNDWIEGRALSYTDCMGYWTARNLLQNLLGVAEDADLEEVGRRLNKAVAEVCPDELAEVYPYLGHFLDVPLEQSMVERVLYLEPQQLQSRVHRAFETFIKARALCYPQILVWEDLHWSDPSSLNMLGSLMHLPQECPLLMLLLFRPRESDRIWEWHQKLSEDYPESYETISLEPLSRGDSGRLVANLLHIEGLPEETRQLLLDKSEGNPFFLEEILRSLLDAGIVVLEGRRARAKRAISHVDVPNTLQGVIAARVDRLPAGDKQTLQMAAVIGRIFQQSVLAFLAEQQQCAGGLEESLDLFQYRELVNPYHGRSFGLEYIFKHALTHEVTYRSLLRSRRRTLHKNTALAIEETFPEHPRTSHSLAEGGGQSG
jgi:class 3 adenylate cyclase